MNAVLDIAIDVHRELGPGLLESAYEAIIADELVARGHTVQRQLTVPIRFKERTYDRGYRLDLLVDNAVVVEIKSTERASAIFEQQVLTYLRGLGLRHGMVVNLGLSRAIDGVHRVTNYRVAEVGDVGCGKQTTAKSQLLAEQTKPTEPAEPFHR